MSTSAPSMFELLRNRFIQVILLSALCLQIGIWVRNFSILLFVVEQTNGNAYAVSAISVAEFAPIFIFSFIGGTFADRWRPKRTMIWCDILSAVSILAVLLTLVYGSWKTVFFATLISAILSQFSQPSGMKLFKLHVPTEHVQAGMSLYQTMFAIFMILGPVLGTFVYQHFGISVAIGIMGVAFLLSAAVLLLLPPDRLAEKVDESSSIWKEMKQGFSYVLSKKVLTTLGGCFIAAGLGLGVIQPLAVFIVTERLGLPKENLQWLMAVYGVAMIVGGALAMIFARNVAPQRMLAIGMSFDAVGIMIAGLSTNLWLTLFSQFISGLGLPAIQIGINTMILQNTDESYVGRVNGILTPLFIGSMVVTMSLAGWLKELLSLVVLYQVAAGLFVIGIMIILPLMKMKAPAVESPSSEPSSEEPPSQALTQSE